MHRANHTPVPLLQGHMQTSALPHRMVGSPARTLHGSVLYVDGVAVGLVTRLVLDCPTKGEAPAKKFGGSFSINGPRGAEDPGNPPDVRA